MYSFMLFHRNNSEFRGENKTRHPLSIPHSLQYTLLKRTSFIKIAINKSLQIEVLFVPYEQYIPDNSSLY